MGVVLACSLQWGWCSEGWNEIWSNNAVEQNQWRQFISAILVESVVIQQSRVANRVIFVMLNEENLTQETGGWAETDQDLNLVNLQSWTSYIITHNASYSFLQWVSECICPRPIRIPSYMLVKFSQLPDKRSQLRLPRTTRAPWRIRISEGGVLILHTNDSSSSPMRGRKI